MLMLGYEVQDAGWSKCKPQNEMSTGKKNCKNSTTQARRRWQKLKLI